MGIQTSSHKNLSAPGRKKYKKEACDLRFAKSKRETFLI